MLSHSLAKWVAHNNIPLPKGLLWRLGNALAKADYNRAKSSDIGSELPNFPNLPLNQSGFDQTGLKFLLEYPWLDHLRLSPTVVGVPDVLVFMPTYSPDAKVGPGFRPPAILESYLNIMQRGWQKEYEVPWTYLDAIDSVFHSL